VELRKDTVQQLERATRPDQEGVHVIALLEKVRMAADLPALHHLVVEGAAEDADEEIEEAIPEERSRQEIDIGPDVVEK
jgi:hypothetical protein